MARDVEQKSCYRSGMSIEVVTFGCRLNAYESEVIRREAQAAGLADTIVVNTCAVTAEAVRQRAAARAHRGDRLRGADRA
jgi:threonylcarbamoyladenosine tRNA methylthiotransferase MtaB